jgi:hypothetical protein
MRGRWSGCAPLQLSEDAPELVGQLERRFVLGLGVSHAPSWTYLNAMDTAPWQSPPLALGWGALWS